MTVPAADCSRPEGHGGSSRDSRSHHSGRRGESKHDKHADGPTIHPSHSTRCERSRAERRKEQGPDSPRPRGFFTPRQWMLTNHTRPPITRNNHAMVAETQPTLDQLAATREKKGKGETQEEEERKAGFLSTLRAQGTREPRLYCR